MFESDKIYLLDGSLATFYFEKRGLVNYPIDLENIKDEDFIKFLHVEFIDAGSDIIRTNTFNSNPLRLKKFFPEINPGKVIKNGVKIVDELKKRFNILTAASIGPIGRDFFKYDIKEVMRGYEYEVESFMERGVDLFLVETQILFNEAKLIVEIIRRNSKLPIVVSFSYIDDLKLLSGETPKEVAYYFSDKVDVIGVNCLKEISDYEYILAEYESKSDLPLAIFPNGGTPIEVSGKLKYPLKPELFSKYVKIWLNYRIKIVGGCCGISPIYIKKINWIKS